MTFRAGQRPSGKRTRRHEALPTPRTELDERFSEPDSDATSWHQARSVLETAELTWLTTVRADGRPHQSPLVTVWLGGALHFSCGTRGQKNMNLRTNPHVLLTVADRRWDEGLDVVVEGDAVRVTDDATLRRLAEAWTT